MIQFDKLQVLPNNRGIDIEISIMDLPYFNNVYLKSIVIDTQDTYREGGPSSSPIYSYTIGANKKTEHIIIPENELLTPSMDGTLFFVYITADGSPAFNTPCGIDKKTVVGVCYNQCNILRKGMKHMQDAYNECIIPRKYIDFILRQKAFEMCLKTENFPLAITYWNGFWESIVKSDTSKCACYG